MDRRAAGALLALAACIASSAAAPTANNQTGLDLYDAASEGCYYNFQHYGEGDRIMTNEPCLNCTCHNRMLMCYLRVCPFTKPIGQDCTVEKRADQCCPIVTCPDVPVDLLTSTSTSSPAEYGATGLGKLDKYGCSINGKYFPEGSKVPPTPNKPCEHCYCIRNMTTCVMQECTLHVDGCTPIYHKDVCCPVRYSCDHPEDEMPLLDDMSTTVRPTPGFLLTTTTLSPVTQMTQDCVHNDQIFPDGTSIKTEKACEHCYCMKGDIVCVVQECGTPMENEGKNCTSQPPRDGQCCPDTYICEGDEVTTESLLDFTTEPSVEKSTRKVFDEGSGYRKEEELEPATELPPIESEVEGSGEDYSTSQSFEETERQTPSLIDEIISNTEGIVHTETTPESVVRIDDTTFEPDREFNTIPTDVTESSETPVAKLTTVSEESHTSHEMEQTYVDNKYTTLPAKEKEEVSVHTTESAFRKEDESHEPHDVITEKMPEEITNEPYYTITEKVPKESTPLFESTRVTKEDLLQEQVTGEQEPMSTISETKFTTPIMMDITQTEIVTEISTSASDKSDKESGTSFDHTEKESVTTSMLDKFETTTLNAQENEIEDISTAQGPGRIPGEGDCLQNGITYNNESTVPSVNNCQTDCKCISSIIKCDPIICSPPPEYMNNCVPTYDSLESCCPTYVCDGSKETIPPQPHSQMSETTSSTPASAIECQDDQCEVQQVDKLPMPSDNCNSEDCMPKPSDIPESNGCGGEGCNGIVQTPVQIDVKPECSSEECNGAIQPVPHEISSVPPKGCSDSECQSQPIDRDSALLPCDNDNCVKPPIKPCENEEECKTVNIPDIESSCKDESCGTEPTDCKDGNCKIPTAIIPVIPSCEGDHCSSKDVQSSGCLDEECKKTNIPDISGQLPSECNGSDCISQPESTVIPTAESIITTHDKSTEIFSITTDNLQPDVTKSPEYDNKEYTQTSVPAEEAITDKDTIVIPTDIPQAGSEKPLHDSDEHLEITDRPFTNLPVETTEYEQVADTTPVSDLIKQTVSRHESDIESMPTLLPEVIPETTEVTENIEQNEAATETSKLPDEQSVYEDTTTPGKQTENLPEIQETIKSTTISPHLKPEKETTESTTHETLVQSDTEGLPESTIKPELEVTSKVEQHEYTKEPEEEATEIISKPTKESQTEISQTESPTDVEKTTHTPVEASIMDQEITTSSLQIIEKNTEETRLGTSATPDLYTSPSSATEVSTDKHDEQTTISGIHQQEPTLQTTSPETQDDNMEPHKQDGITSPDIDSTTNPSFISLETDVSVTEKPLNKEDKIPNLTFEETYTEQVEINTEEPSLITQQEDLLPQEPIEPETPEYIPVHPTVDDKSEPDMVDKDTTESPYIVASTESQIKTTTSTSDIEVQTDKSVIESMAPGQDGEVVTSNDIITEQYDSNKPTESFVEISTTDNRKYNQDTTDIFEPATKTDEVTSTYPTEEKSTVSLASSESSTKQPIEEQLYTTTRTELFSTDNQDITSTQMPESHIKETGTEENLTTLEPNAVKLKPVTAEESHTQSSAILEPNPTEAEPPSISVELETDTYKLPEHTSEHMIQYSETMPDMIELVEHNGMLDVSTVSSSTNNQETTISADTEKPYHDLTTINLDTKTEFERTTTSPTFDIEDKIKDETVTKQPDVETEQVTISEHPSDNKPEDESTTLKSDLDQTKPENNLVQETSSEQTEPEKDYSTDQPQLSELDHQALPSEPVQTDKPEIQETDVDQFTTKRTEEIVTEPKLDVKVEFSTEEPETSDIEIHSDKQHTTERPDIDQKPTTEQESSRPESAEPSIDEQTVTDKTTETKEPDEPIIENEVKPDKEIVKPTDHKESTPAKEPFTEKPVVPLTESAKPAQVYTTESPIILETIKETEIVSSTEQVSLPEIVTSRPESSITEKETTDQEFITKKPEADTHLSSTLPSESISENEFQPEHSTEKSVTDIDMEYSTKQPEALDDNKDTEPSVVIDTTEPDKEIFKPFPEKEYTTEKPETDVNIKESPEDTPEPSDVENEITDETTTLVSKPEKEHKFTTETPITKQPVPSSDQDIELKSSTERISTTDSDHIADEEVSILSTSKPDQVTNESEASQPTLSHVTEITKGPVRESTTEIVAEATTISSFDSKTSQPAISDDQKVHEIVTKEPEVSEVSIPEHETELNKDYTTEKTEIPSDEYEITTAKSKEKEKETSTTKHDIVSESVTNEPEKPEIEVEDQEMTYSSEHPVNDLEIAAEATTLPSIEEFTNYNEKQTSTVKSDHNVEKLTTIPVLSSTPSYIEEEDLSNKLTNATPDIQDERNEQDEHVTKNTTPGYSSTETIVSLSESEKPSLPDEEIPDQIKPETEKPIEISTDTTAPEEEFLSVTTKPSTPKVQFETSTHSVDLDKTTKPHDIPEEVSVVPSEVPKPGFNEVQPTEEEPGHEDESHFSPSATGGYGQEPDYEDENQPFGPGTCRYGGKVYVSAQQIPRDDPCDFCFCFRSDIICLQQSCPPPIHGCHEEPIQGFCCPRYECPVSMASTLNVTTTTTTTTTTLPPHFLPHAYQGAVQRRGCQIKGHTYKVGEVVRASSGPCLHCTCGGDGQMKCDPKACTPEPMLRQMIAAAVSAKRRR
ncbi:mucin-2 [Amyelois transitella]|uniref:mucin-2 n=1 Tax=Amyelois transitella TaxID=680683 RepID=UPI00299030FF|nr:mucin-2 [Amyelois transitella]